jgi:hypothetical protein
MSWSPRAAYGLRRRGLTFSYQESELTGLEGTLTTFQVEPDRITLMRMGRSSQMVFQLGKAALLHVRHPLWGAGPWRINTRKMRSNLNEDGGEIEIDYAIESTTRWRGRTCPHQRAGKRAAAAAVGGVDFGPKRFAKAKTLMPGEFTSPAQIKWGGAPRRLRRGESTHAVAGENLFRINVREKGRCCGSSRSGCRRALWLS